MEVSTIFAPRSNHLASRLSMEFDMTRRRTASALRPGQIIGPMT